MVTQISNQASEGQRQQLLKAIDEQGLSPGEVQRLFEEGLIADLLEVSGPIDRREFRKSLGLGLLTPDIIELPGVVIPKRSVTLEQRVEALGALSVDMDMNDRYFSLKLPPGPRDLILVFFDKVMSIEDLKAWREENGCEDAYLDDLLAVGSHPEHSRFWLPQAPTIQLGTFVRIGVHRIPYLHHSKGHGRYGLRLDLEIPYEPGFKKEYRYLFSRTAAA